MTETPEGVVVTLKREIERQCGIGAGSFAVDDGIDQSGLWQINADLDPNGLRKALAHTPTLRGEEVERLREALRDYRSAFGQALEAHGIPFGEQQRQADEAARAALSQPLAVDTGQSGEDTPRRAALRAMVAMDEELEAEHPGWMDGTVQVQPESAEQALIGVISRLTHTGDDGWMPSDEHDAQDALDALIARARTIRAATPAPSVSPDPAGEAIKGEGFISSGPGAGGFATIIVGKKRYTAKQLLAALASSPIPKTFPREAVENRLVEVADNAGAFDSGDAVVSIEEALQVFAALVQEDRQS